MNIILTAINAKYIHSNLAVYSLKAYAKEYLDQIVITEYTINQQTDDILMDLYKKKPDILCFSCYIWNITYVKSILREIRKLYKDIPIWLGGPEVSYDAKKVLEELPEVTGVMMGEGEKTFVEVLDYYHGKVASLSNVKGITYRTENGIQENPWREVMDLSEVPFVYQDLEKFKNKIIYYESSRGCPFSCSYCLSSVDKCLRFRDLDLVKRELKFFLDAKIPQVKFVDRTFNCNHQRCIDIFQFILDHDNGITNFHFEVAADLLNEEELNLIEKMRPGCIQLEIGVQSTNLKTIDEIQRKMDFHHVASVVKRINAGENVHQHLDLIAGLPYEDMKSFQCSFDDVYAVEPEQLQLGFLKVLKGSYMEEMKDSYGMVFQSQPPYEVLYTKWLSYEDVLLLKGVEEMVEVYYNSRQFEATIFTLGQEYESKFQLYLELGKFYEENGYHMIKHTRISRYKILLEFIQTFVSEDKYEMYKELLAYDLYLRENLKNRPDFLLPYSVTKDELHMFYDKESKEHNYLKDYDEYDRRQLRKMTHLEKFKYNVTKYKNKDNIDLLEQETYILFDYQHRNPLNYQAAIYNILLIL
ncbi:MAG: B12-binding domain-containing radical SAM protein [Anaerostipes sp.]|nr:B12-binding domain-containing radical SAM protein [Anaerostipes sp.]